MKKTLTIIISILIILGIMVIGLISILDEEQTISGDSLMFKEEYELLNGKYYEENNLTLPNLEITKDNPMIYVDENEIIDKLTNGTHILYLGYPECSWCRRTVPILLNLAQNNKIETIYYYNFYKLRTDYEAGTNEKKTNLYKNIINILNDFIDTTYEDGEKQLSAPMVIFIKNGKIVGSHYKLVKSYEDYNIDLTEEQKDELLNIYQNYYNLMFTNVCDKEC